MREDWQNPNWGDPSDFALRDRALELAIHQLGPGAPHAMFMKVVKDIYKFLKGADQNGIANP